MYIYIYIYIYIFPGEVDRFNANREKYWKNMEGNEEIWETWRKYGRNMGKMGKYEGMWKYEGNMGAIFVDNMYTKQCVYLDHRKSKLTLLSKAK